MKEITGRTVVGIMKLSLVGFIALVIFGTAPVQAQTLTQQDRQLIITQINSLLEQIHILQEQLDAKRNELSEEIEEPYKTKYYSDSVEIILPVRSGELVTTADTRPVDVQLFNWLRDTLGEGAMRTYIREFRVFNDEDRDIGAFVELKTGTDDWIVGVNRDTYSSYHDEYRDQVVEIYQELFIHEFAHILAFYEKGVVDEFAGMFWESADWQHSRYLESISGDENRFDAMTAFYYKNDDEYVSDYATMSPDEDVAETFMEYVLKDNLDRGYEEKDTKIRWLDQYNDFSDARSEIRDNLNL